MNNPSSDRLYDRSFLIAVATNTFFVCSNSLMAHYARWIEFLGGSLAHVGWIVGISAACGLILRPWMGQWINRLGARTLWAAGYAVMALASISNLAIDDVGWLIYISRSGVIVGAAMIVASGLTYVTQIAPPGRQTEAIGIYGIGSFVGMLIGPLMGDLFLSSRERGNFELLFIVATVASTLPIVAIYFLRPTETENSGRSVGLGEFFRTSRKYWPGTIVLVNFAFGICMCAPFVFLSSFIDDASLRIEGISVIGLYFSCYAAIGITIRFTSRRWPERFGSESILIAGMFIMAIGLFSFGLVTSTRAWLIVVPALLTGVGHGLTFHTMASLSIAPFPMSVRGTGTALTLIMMDLGMISGPPVLGVIGERFGYAALFATMGGVAVITTGLYANSRRGSADTPQEVSTNERSDIDKVELAEKANPLSEGESLDTPRPLFVEQTSVR